MLYYARTDFKFKLPFAECWTLAQYLKILIVRATDLTFSSMVFIVIAFNMLPQLVDIAYNPFKGLWHN